MSKRVLLIMLLCTAVCTSTWAQQPCISVDSVVVFKNKVFDGQRVKWVEYLTFHANLFERYRNIPFTETNLSKWPEFNKGEQITASYSWACNGIDYPLSKDTTGYDDLNVNISYNKKSYSVSFGYKVYLGNGIVQIDSVKGRKKYLSYTTDVSRYQVDKKTELSYGFIGSGKVGDKYIAVYDPLKPYHCWLILPTQAVVSASAPDTSVATLVPLRRFPIDAGLHHCDAFKIVFIPKDSLHTHTIELPYFESTERPSGAKLYVNFPALSEKRRFYVVYDKKTPDNIRLINNPPADTGKFHYNKRNNIVTVNTIATTMTVIGYEHKVSKYFSLGANWAYFLPNISEAGSYGFSDPEGGVTSFFSDIPNSMYKVGWANRVELNLKFYPAFDNVPPGMYFRLYYAYEEIKNIAQIYFNVSTYYGRILLDSSVTQFLASSPSHQVYYRQVSFNAQGWGIGMGIDIPIDRLSRFWVGLEIGAESFIMPDYAKQPVIINGQAFYYQYTPAWESVLNSGGYGHINLVYRF